MNLTSRLEAMKESNGRGTYCYDSKLTVLSNETTLILSNTRELDRIPSTK